MDRQILIKIILIAAKSEQATAQRNVALRNILAENQLAVLEIKGFSEAIAHCGDGASQRPDLVLLNLDLSDVSGEYAVKQLQGVAPHLPIIALVSPQQEQMAIGLFKFGLQDYLLTDQINRRSLMRAIACALERQRYMSSLCQRSPATDEFRKDPESNGSAIELKGSDAVGFGTWQVDLNANRVKWSEELADLLGDRAIQPELNRQPELVVDSSLCQTFFQAAPTGMVIFDRQWRAMQINPALGQINGRSPEEYLGKKITEIWPEISSKLMAKMQQVWQTGQALLAQEIGDNGLRIDEHQQHWSWSMFPLYDGGGQIAAIGCFIEEISDRKRAEKNLRQQWLREYLIGAIEERIRQSLNLEDVLDAAVEEVRKFLQTDRVIIYRFNSEHSGVAIAESVANGWTKTLGMQIRSQCFWNTYFPMYQQGWICSQENINSSASEPEICPVDLFTKFELQANLVVPILQGDNLWGLLIAHHCQSPRQWDSSEIEALRQISLQLGAALKQSDLFEQLQAELQERQQVEAALRQSEQRLQLALKGSALGLWDWDLTTGKVYVSPQWKSLLGYETEDIADRVESWQPLVHPQDLLQMKRVLRAHLRGRTPVFEAEFRMRSKSDEWKWIGCYGQVSQRDRSGKPLRMTGTNKDISDRKQAAEAIERERQQLHHIVTHAPVAMAILDRELRYLAHSQKWLTTYGLVGEEILGRYHYEVFPDIPDRWQENYQKALQGKIVSIAEEYWQRGNGEKMYLRRSIHPWYTSEGKVGGIAIASDRIDQLVEAREQALAAVRFKSQFFANMSHEIRTPMNGVLAMSELLLQTPLNPEQLDFVQTLKVSGNHLLSIINDLLDFSKLEAAQMRLDLHEFDLNKCIENAIDLLNPQANAKGLQLAVLVEPDVPRQLVGDDLRLRQILTNLISNGIKFTETGEVVIYVEYIEPEFNSRTKKKTIKKTISPNQPDQVILKLSVKDTGIGIPIAEQKQLFQVFSQVHQSSRKYGGTGLGLAICKQFVEMMGGEIGVKSKVGQGATFWFTATFALATTTADVAEDVVDVTPLSKSEQMLGVHRYYKKVFSGKKLLVIDRHATSRKAVRLAASAWGIQVEETDNYVTALTNLCSVTVPGNTYDVILVDWQILKVDREFRAQLFRIHTAMTKTKFILMTSVTESQPAKQLFGYLFSDYLVKPITENRFKKTLLKVLGSKPEHQLPLNSQRSQTRSDIKILVVEDTPINQKVIQHQLTILGYQADLVSNGQAALNQLLKKDYDLVFMDCQVPVLDGYQATQALRKREASIQAESQSKIRTAVIGLTAYGMNDENPDGSGLNNREKCLAAGMDDYLSKPASLEELGAAIHRWTKAESEQPEIGEKLPTNFAQLVNWQHLAKITTGNIALQQQLLELLIHQAQTNLDNAETALENGDYETVLANAHQLKGASANVGAIAIPELAAELECLAKESNLSGNLNGAIALIHQLRQKLAQLQGAIADEEKLDRVLTNVNLTNVNLTNVNLAATKSPEKQPAAKSAAKLAIVSDSNPWNETIPINFDRLHKLSGGNTAFESKLLQTFVDQVDTYLDRVMEALAAKNYFQIARKVHQIKGASHNVGVLGMPDIARQIEANVKIHNFTAIPEQVAQLQQIHQQLKKFVACLSPCLENDPIATASAESEEIKA